MNHLRFLRYADEVARTGSIRRAAERLHVAPSAVNRRIQDLEEEIGVPLFERLPRGMRLTAAGELFINYVRGRQAQLDQVLTDIEELRGLRRGRVQIVVSQALAPSFMPAAVASFRASHPLVAVNVRVGDHAHAMEGLRQFDTDLALIFNLPQEGDARRLAEAEQKLVATMHASHPLAAKASLRLRDCAEYPIVLPSAEIGGRQLLERFLARSSIRLQPLVESNSFEFMRGYLLYEQAVSFQIAIGAVTQGSELVAREIDERGFPGGQLVLACLRGRQLPTVAHAFAEHLTVELTKLPAGVKAAKRAPQSRARRTSKAQAGTEGEHRDPRP